MAASAFLIYRSETQLINALPLDMNSRFMASSEVCLLPSVCNPLRIWCRIVCQEWVNLPSGMLNFAPFRPFLAKQGALGAH